MKPDVSFEASLVALESIVVQLEDGQLGLTDALARYEEGIKHLRHCHQALQAAERKIELLAGVDAEGNAMTEPFDDTQLSLEEKAQSRSKRRSRATNKGGPEDESPTVRDEGPQLF